MGLRPKSRANLRHPDQLKTSLRTATSQLYERSFIVGFGRKLSLFIFSITKAIWPIGTFEVTALAVVAFEFWVLSPSALCGQYFPVDWPSLFVVGCTHEFPPSIQMPGYSHWHHHRFRCCRIRSSFSPKKGASHGCPRPPLHTMRQQNFS